MRTIKKILLFIAIGLMVLYFLITLQPGSWLLTRLVQRQMSEFLDVPVQIDRIHTNLFNSIHVDHFSLGPIDQTQPPILSFKKLHVNVNLWALFTNKISLSRLEIDQLSVRISKDSTGCYHLPKKLFGSEKPVPSTEAHKARRFQVAINQLRINNMQIGYLEQRDSLRIELRQMQIGLDTKASDNSKIGRLTAQSGELGWRRMSQFIRTCEIGFTIDPDLVDITKLVLATEDIQIAGNMQYHLADRTISDGHIQAALGLNLLDRIIADSHPRRFQGQVEIDARFAGPVNHPSAMLRILLHHGRIYDWPVDHLTADLSLHNKTIRLTNLSAATLGGEVAAVGELTFGADSLHYDAKISLRRLSLKDGLANLYNGSFIPMTGVINAELLTSGTGSDPRQWRAQGHFVLSHLMLNSKPLPQIQARLSFETGRFHFLLDQNDSKVHLVGHIGADQSLAGRFDADLNDVASIAAIVGLVGLSGQLKLTGDLSGSLPAPVATMNLHFRDGNFKGLPMTEITAGAYYDAANLVISHLHATGSASDLSPLVQHLALDSLKGELLYDLTARGTIRNLISQVRIDWNHPMINHMKFDRARLIAMTAGTTLTLDTLHIGWQNHWLRATGQLHWQPDLAGELSFGFFEHDSLSEAAKQRGTMHLHGRWSDQSLQATMTADSIAIALFAPLLDLPGPIAGQLRMEAHLHGRPDQPQLTLRAHWRYPSYRTFGIDSLVAELAYRNKMLTIAEFQAFHRAGTLSIDGQFPVPSARVEKGKTASLRLSLQAHHFDLDFLSGFLPDSMRFEGMLSGDVEFQSLGSESQATGQLHIDSARLIMPTFDLRSIELKAQFDGSTLRLTQFAGKINQFPFHFQGEAHLGHAHEFAAQLQGSVAHLGQIQLTAQRRADRSVAGTVHIPDLNLGTLFQLLALNLQPTGMLDIRAELSGSDSKPSIEVLALSPRITYETAQLDSLYIHAKYHQHHISLTRSGFKIGNGVIQMEGLLPWAVLLKDHSESQDQQFQFRLRAQELDIDWLRPFFSDAEQLHGSVNSQIALSGTLEQPFIVGSIELTDALVKIKKLDPPITAINSRIDFFGDSIRIANFSGKVGLGNFVAQGQALLKPAGLSTGNVNLKLEKIKLSVPQIAIVGIERSELNLVQLDDRFSLKGTIQLSEARYIQDFRPRISQFLTRLPSRSSELTEALNDIELDIIIQGTENIWIENNLAKLQLSAQLNVLGTLAQPNIAGRVVVQKGYVLYLDRKFKLSNGTLFFSDPHRINPLIDLTAVCEVTDYQESKEVNYTITLKLSGLLEKPEFSLTSEPALDRANIVSMLTLGRTRESLLPQSSGNQRASLQQVMLTRFQQIGAHRLADYTEQKLSEALALENISIEGNLLQWDKPWAPKITASKRISERFNITYSTVVGHATEQQIKLGYQMSKYFSIVGNTGQLGQSGIDLKFHYKFY